MPPATRAVFLLWSRAARRPVQFSTLYPSSSYVGRAFARAIKHRPALPVIELGAGTGAVTRALLGAGVGPQDLTCVEIDRKLGEFLQDEFPGVEVNVMPAQELGDLWRAEKRPPVGAIVSTMPARTFSRDLIADILDSAKAVLAPGGLLVQFTYLQRSPFPLSLIHAAGFTQESRALVWANLPPTTIWVYRRN
ncbi:MAG: class I SAM-dependent methyltransferase [Alphaproteobacteria bacterium]